METIMEKSDHTAPRAIIFSHPRSGLHYLRCGLYLLEGGTESYHNFWSTYDVLYAHHVPQFPNISTEQFIQMYEEHDVKIILLLRNYHQLFPKTVYPMILNAYVNLAPEKLKLLHPDVDMEKALNTELSDLDRFGSFAFDDHKYADLIKFHSTLPSSINKKIVFYDELMSNDAMLLEVADLIGIEYTKDTVDMNKIRAQTKQLYAHSGHFPSPPEGKPFGDVFHGLLEEHYRSEFSHNVYEQYLKRFEGVYK